MFRLFRIIPILLMIVMLITILRSVIGVVMKMFGNLVSAPGNGSNSSPNGAKRPTMQVSGELHRDPICGTFVSDSTAFQRQDASQRFYYCSETCRSQHALVSR
jgi:hypothetical protein